MNPCKNTKSITLILKPAMHWESTMRFCLKSSLKKFPPLLLITGNMKIPKNILELNSQKAFRIILKIQKCFLIHDCTSAERLLFNWEGYISLLSHFLVKIIFEKLSKPIEMFLWISLKIFQRIFQLLKKIFSVS